MATLMHQPQPITMLYMSPEEFTDYLYKAMEKGREIEKNRSLQEDYLSRKEVLEMLNIKSYTTLGKLLKNKEFHDTKAGIKKSEVLAYIERTKKM